jgi:hypothetical protein
MAFLHDDTTNGDSGEGCEHSILQVEATNSTHSLFLLMAEGAEISIHLSVGCGTRPSLPP